MASVATHEALVGGAVAAHPNGRAGFIGTVRSEFTKIRSVRSTYWTLIALVVACVGLGALISWARTQSYVQFKQGNGGVFIGRPGVAPVPAGRPPASAVAALADTIRSHAASMSLTGLFIGQLIIVVLGAIVITSEYSTGMVRTSLWAMPRRSTLYAAKGIVFGTIALVTGLITSFLAFFVGQAILSTQNLGVSIGYPEALRTALGGGLFLAACGLLAFGLGAILRHTAGAISAGIGLLFVVTFLINALPNPSTSWYGQPDVDKWVPFDAGAGLWARTGMLGVNPFSPWIGFGVFCAYVAALIIGGLALFLRRDA